MKWLRNMLFPIVPIYYTVTKLRNWLYDKGLKSGQSYDFPVLCVGNLSVGGTGKTPMIEYLIRMLRSERRVATLSRGYKRTTQGFVLANESATAESIGDEPFQFYNKFKDQIAVAVDEDRRRGIENLKKRVNPDLILLDDAFQHRKVKAKLNILLTVYGSLYVNDWLLPTGNLREPISGAHRADIIVVTKCPPDLSIEERNSIRAKLHTTSNQSLFFSSILYADEVVGPKTVAMSNLGSMDFTLVTGIANPTPLVDHLKSKGLKFEHLDFPDHHNFTYKEVDVLASKKLILTTEKDYMRLRQFSSLAEKLFYLPMEFRLDKPKEFEDLVKKSLSIV